RCIKEHHKKYIARIDTEYYSLQKRFKKQTTIMDDNPEIANTGTWIIHTTEKGIEPRKKWCPPTDPALVRWALLFGTPLAHPTWIMRRKIVESMNFYRKISVEDYDLLIRCTRTTQIAN